MTVDPSPATSPFAHFGGVQTVSAFHGITENVTGDVCTAVKIWAVAGLCFSAVSWKGSRPTGKLVRICTILQEPPVTLHLSGAPSVRGQTSWGYGRCLNSLEQKLSRTDSVPWAKHQRGLPHTFGRSTWKSLEGQSRGRPLHRTCSFLAPWGITPNHQEEWSQLPSDPKDTPLPQECPHHAERPCTAFKEPQPTEKGLSSSQLGPPWAPSASPASHLVPPTPVTLAPWSTAGNICPISKFRSSFWNTKWVSRWQQERNAAPKLALALCEWLGFPVWKAAKATPASQDNK